MLCCAQWPLRCVWLCSPMDCHPLGSSVHGLVNGVNFYYFIWPHWVLVAALRTSIPVAACGISSCSQWDLVPRPGMKPRPLALGAQNLSHWTTREVPHLGALKQRPTKHGSQSVANQRVVHLELRKHSVSIIPQFFLKSDSGKKKKLILFTKFSQRTCLYYN